jgi:hypothetical protein
VRVRGGVLANREIQGPFTNSLTVLHGGDKLHHPEFRGKPCSHLNDLLLPTPQTHRSREGDTKITKTNSVRAEMAMSVAWTARVHVWHRPCERSLVTTLLSELKIQKYFNSGVLESGKSDGPRDCPVCTKCASSEQSWWCWASSEGAPALTLLPQCTQCCCAPRRRFLQLWMRGQVESQKTDLAS